MTQKVEFPCTGNHGRSVPAAAIASIYIWQKRIPHLEAISSGTLVDAIQRVQEPHEAMKRTVQTAFDRGNIYTPEDIDAVQRAIRQDDKGAIKTYFSIAYKVFHHEEGLWREDWHQRAQKKYGLEFDIKQTQDQTVPRADVRAVLSIAGKNNQHVIDIYNAAEGYTQISDTEFRGPGGIIIVNTLPGFLGIEGEIVNAFGKTKADYDRTMEQLEEMVPLAIDKLVGHRL